MPATTTFGARHHARTMLGLLLLVPALMAPGPPSLAPVRFSIARDGAALGLFETCRGLGTANEVIEYRSGGDPGQVQKIPGQLQLLDVICTRSAAAAADLLAWRALVVSGDVAHARSKVTISELDMTASVVRSWTLTRAWPAELQAIGGTTGTVELLRIAHEGIERTQ
ncbi:MAG: phage tail protein [Deltaproteobacteria bacterium]|nr:phage tail protein [Deltaproteobacteria bacterium]